MTQQRLVLHFPPDILDQPIIYKLIRDHNLVFNILRARVIPEEEGILVLEITGEEADFQKGLDYLKEQNVKIESISNDIVRIEERCTHCGLCVTFCPSGALSFDKKTMKVIYEPEKCVACLECIEICPLHAFVSRV